MSFDKHIKDPKANVKSYIFNHSEIILSDNFQSDIRGSVGDPRKYKKYAVGNIS